MADLCRLHYLTYGRPGAPAIVFMHGFLGSGLDWEEIIPTLSEDFYCVAVDLPGHGQTRGSSYPEAYTLRGAAQAIQVILDEMAIEQCALVGYSMGGRLALYLAMGYPQRWTGIVMESASPGIKSPLDQAQRRELDEMRAEQLEKASLEVFLDAWYQQPLFVSLKRDPARFLRLLERRRRNHPIELAKALRGMGAGIQPSLWNKLPQLELPLLAITGEYDRKYQQVAQQMVRLCKKARVAIVPQAGHNAHAENPREYSRLLREFLTEVCHEKNRVERSRKVYRHQVP